MYTINLTSLGSTPLPNLHIATEFWLLNLMRHSREGGNPVLWRSET